MKREGPRKSDAKSDAPPSATSAEETEEDYAYHERREGQVGSAGRVRLVREEGRDVSG